MLQYKAHPWHGVEIGEDAPEIVTAYIEMVPTDSSKYEIDKPSGILKLDRPQQYSSFCPALYGLLPKTYCGKRVGKYCEEKTGQKGIKGDGDPLDICVFAEKTIAHGNILVRAIPIGGLRLIDKGEADDKIIAVLSGDYHYGHIREISDCPQNRIDRICHYFLTYKDSPDNKDSKNVKITDVYGRREAFEVIHHSLQDYQEHFGDRINSN